MNFLNKISSFLVLIGVFAIVMGFMDRVPKILIWIYKWGESTAWVIKIGLVVGGGILWFITTRMEAKNRAAESSSEIEKSEENNA